MTDDVILIRRNVKAIAEALERDQKSIQEALQALKIIQQTVTMHAQQIQRLEQLVMALTASSGGRGSTVR